MLSADVKKLFSKNEYLIIASSDTAGNPNAAPMFLIEVEDKFVYLIDYTKGTTWRNFKANPKVSAAIADLDTLRGFKLNGLVELIEEGDVYERIEEKVKARKLNLTADRVIEGVRGNVKHHAFEVELPESFVVYKIEITDVIEIGSQGRIQSRKQ